MNFSNPVRGVRMLGIEDFRRITLLASALMSEHLKKGDSAIDATAGTGVDTCMLAQCVGKTGVVYAFDIQASAIRATYRRLEEKGLANRVILYHKGHEVMEEQPEILKDKYIMGIMFNLGYLPHGNEFITTKTDTTLRALTGALSLLAPKGLLSICLYRHPEGLSESIAVTSWCSGLGSSYNVHKIETINKNNPPYLILVEKTK